MNPKISIIIPIYNVERYLPKCLDSVCNQTYKDLEIICVNDCSPDDSLEICQRYATKDSRIRIVDREQNGGLSAARNSGLEVASGEYVYFIDSDDWIDLDYIEKMVAMIQKHSVDMVCNVNVFKVTRNGFIEHICPHSQKKDPEGEFVDKITAINNNQTMIPCHLYRKQFLEKYKLRFLEGYIHEDEIFHHISKIHLDKLFVFYGPTYYYLQRNDSIMSSRKNKIDGHIKLLSFVYNFYKQNNLLNKNNSIKIFRVNYLSNIKNEQEFLLIKNHINLISKDFEEERMASSDFEKFMVKHIKKINSFDEWRKVIGKNIFFTYMTRYRITRRRHLKVSVIIPVYNVAKYLPKCLDYICAQTFENIEIICVNDCSPDNSLAILQEYASMDNRIRIINREQNGGLSAARNSGLEVASGEYVYFIDSDDWIDLDYIEKMVSEAVKNDAKVVLNTNMLTENNGRKFRFSQELTKNNISNVFLPANECIWSLIWSACAYLWKKSFLDSINARFPQGYVIEDMYFQAITFAQLDKVYVIVGGTYHYVARDNSIAGNFKANLLSHNYALLKIFHKVVDDLEQKDLLKTANIKLFVLLQIGGNLDKKIAFIKELKKYFLRIKDKVFANRNLYTAIELNFFNAVLNDDYEVTLKKVDIARLRANLAKS
ncbi:glycosyltransferase family 2 protein [Helicobacter sp. T3_23-1056]